MLPLRDHLPTRSVPWVNYALIAANVAAMGAEVTFEGAERWALVPSQLLAHPLAAAPTLLTHMFLHANVAHLAGNMLFLWIFGDNVEDYFGHFGYLLFYFACGIGSDLTHILFNLHSPVPALGASGAISGVMGAYIVLFPRARVLTLVFIFFLPIPAFIILGYWFLLQFLAGITSVGTAATGGTAWWAHIGGFILGMLITFMSMGSKRTYEPSY